MSNEIKSRAFISDAVISSPIGKARIAIDMSGENWLINCDIIGVDVYVGKDVKENALAHCRFSDCQIFLHPDGVGKNAFSGCYFEDGCKWSES